MKSNLESSLKNVSVKRHLDQLQNMYLPKQFESHIHDLKKQLKDCLGLIPVERTDAEGCSVLNIDVALLTFPMNRKGEFGT